MIAERRARALRRKRYNFAIATTLVIALGVVSFFVIQNRSETIQKYAEIDPNKSKGNTDAPVEVMEYGDFQ